MNHPKTIDKYQILRHLGGGHFSEVYRAFDRALQTEKALKVLDITDPNEFLEALIEAQILQRCNHKHIVTINEANIFVVNGQPRVVLDLEYIPEGSLQDAIKGRGLSIREAITCIRGALTGLEYAHSQGFLHRDIKPANILLAPNSPKLSDFGLATAPGSVKYGSGQGYVTHQAPECLLYDITSVRSDVFAAGTTLFRALANIKNWRNLVKKIPNVDRHVERGTLLSTIGYPPYLPASIRRIVAKACAPNPDARYQKASEFGQQLDRLRFAINWVRVGKMEWEGFQGNDSYAAQVDVARNEFVVRKNGRRINRYCRSFGTLTDAVNALHSHIASTTLG